MMRFEKQTNKLQVLGSITVLQTVQSSISYLIAFRTNITDICMLPISRYQFGRSTFSQKPSKVYIANEVSFLF